MPPKITGAKGPKRSGTSAPTHGSYQDMIKDAILNLKDRSGSSRQSIKKYVLANNKLDGVSDGVFTTQFNRALTKGTDSGVFVRPKGPSGTVKLAAPKKAADSKPATKKAPVKKTAATKTAVATTKKAPAKKTATKAASTTTKKAPVKKAAAAKPKANTGKSRKTTAAAPAVEEKPSVVSGKTKSGRVTKSKAPQAEKKAATKKAAPKKAAATKKATPKKTEA